MANIAEAIGRSEDTRKYQSGAASARDEFRNQYITPNGWLVSDSQTAYSLAICFDILTSPHEIYQAGNRLEEIVRSNSYKIGTGFAGTPYVCEALARTGHIDAAYKMLLNEQCPSWLYPISMGATTIWERWDSMRPDGSINPGDMTSFNHYTFGAISKFLVEKLAGLQSLSPGWRASRFEPNLGGGFLSGRATHKTPYGIVSGSWAVNASEGSDAQPHLVINVEVPPTTTMEVVLPQAHGGRVEKVGCGKWTLRVEIGQDDIGPRKDPPLEFPWNIIAALPST